MCSQPGHFLALTPSPAQNESDLPWPCPASLQGGLQRGARIPPAQPEEPRTGSLFITSRLGEGSRACCPPPKPTERREAPWGCPACRPVPPPAPPSRPAFPLWEPQDFHTQPLPQGSAGWQLPEQRQTARSGPPSVPSLVPWDPSIRGPPEPRGIPDVFHFQSTPRSLKASAGYKFSPAGQGFN